MAYKWGMILTTYDTWEPILQVPTEDSGMEFRSAEELKLENFRGFQSNVFHGEV